LQIISPIDKSTVSYPQVVRGTVSGLEADRRLWAVVVPLRSPAYHPQGGAIPVASDGSWSMASCYFGQPTTTSEEFQLVIVSATRQASTALRDYLTTANTTRQYPGLPELPEGAIPLKTINVTRR
jgi:hypothetical protein